MEVRPVGVTKGLATQRMVGLMAEVYGPERVFFDFVLCIGESLRFHVRQTGGKGVGQGRAVMTNLG